MSDNATAANALNGIDPKIAIIIAVVAVMTTLMVWLLRQARDSWDQARAVGNVHRVNLVYLYASAVLLGLGSFFTTGYILLARRDFTNSEFAYPVAALMVVQVLLLIAAPVAVTATLGTGELTQKEWRNIYGRYWAIHLSGILLFVFAVGELGLYHPNLWAKLELLNVVFAALVSLLALFGESWLMWGMAGARERQEVGGGTSMTIDKSEIRHKQTILTQRLAILLAINSLLLLALANLDPVRYASLVKALPVIGLVVGILSTSHLWCKKNDLEHLDSHTGISRYMKGRWISIFLSVGFCVIWAFAIAGAWS